MTDLYQMHHIDRRTPLEEIWQAMELLVQQGKVIYVGSSNFAAWDIGTTRCAAAARHFMGLVSKEESVRAGHPGHPEKIYKKPGYKM